MLAASAALVVFQLVQVAQLATAPPTAVYSLAAPRARAFVVANGLLCLLTLALSLRLPAARRRWALAPAGITLAGSAVGALGFGGHIVGAGAALLTISGAWWMGRHLVARVVAPPSWLRSDPAVAVLIGGTVIGLVTLMLGRVSAVAWWSSGALVVATGLLGAYDLARSVRGRAREPARPTEPLSVLATVAIGIAGLQLAWAIVWVSAPDIMFDALYDKAYLSQLWAHTGTIGTSVREPILNLSGLAQLIAVPGQTLGSIDTGRWLQLFSGFGIGLMLWRQTGWRSVVGPIAAAVFVTVPQVIWQTSTGYDDLLLTFAALTVAIASTHIDRAALTPGEIFAFGFMAGAGAWFKLHLIVLAIVPVGLLIACGPPRLVARRALAAVAGGAVAFLPILALRVIDTGNPVFPAMNGLFKSHFFPPISESFNFPFWPDAGVFGPLWLPFKAVLHPDVLSQAVPPNGYGLLVPFAVFALLLGWRPNAFRNVRVLWIGLIASAVFWWIQFRSLRYGLPLATVSMMLVAGQLAELRWSRAAQTAAAVALGFLAAISLPTTVASFWNVPGRALPVSAAFGTWDRHDYLRTAMPELDTLDAFVREAPPGSTALSEASENMLVSNRELLQPWTASLLSQAQNGIGQTLPTLAQLRTMGVGWVITGPDAPDNLRGAANLSPWWNGLIAQHGQVVFADRGWALYRLVDQPTPSPAGPATCDPQFVGTANCWSGLDAVPGAQTTDHPSRSFAVCPGQIVDAFGAAGGAGGATVVVSTDDPSKLSGVTSAALVGGERKPVYLTVPAGATAATVSVIPTAGTAGLNQLDVRVRGSC